MSEIVTAVIIALLGSSALQVVVQALIDRRREKRERPSTLEKGMRLLLQDKIQSMCTEAIRAGSTTTHEKSYLRQCYEAYHALGGNGDVAQIWDDYNDLQVDY